MDGIFKWRRCQGRRAERMAKPDRGSFPKEKDLGLVVLNGVKDLN
jgi:hypothetical protein